MVVQLVVGLIKVFWLLLPAIALVRLLKSRWWKGMMGERQVSKAIQRHLDRRAYHLFCNILLPTADGTTQLDHVVVSQYGIFVLETKNMQGIISGSKQERTWTQQIGAQCISFQNPLHQNYKHTKTLHELLGINEKHIFSLIVFVGSSSFGTSMPENVVHGTNDAIELIKAQKKKVFSVAQTDAVISAIQSVRLKNTAKMRRKHIQHVQSLVAAKEEESLAQPCPLCGRPMVLREAKRGRNIGRTFWGCSEFPNCEGTRNTS